MISNKCKYILRTILYLSVESNEQNKQSIHDIAEALKIPSPYLGKILQEIGLKKIISSTKGPNGGFYLTRENLQTPIINVIEAVDGLAYFDSCGLGLSECSENHPCPFHDDFKKTRDHLKNLFANRTIEEVAREIKSNDFILT